MTIPYYPLSDLMIESITRHQFAKIARRLRASHDAELVIGDGVMALVKARRTEIESGGRMIDAILTNTLAGIEPWRAEPVARRRIHDQGDRQCLRRGVCLRV